MDLDHVFAQSPTVKHCLGTTLSDHIFLIIYPNCIILFLFNRWRFVLHVYQFLAQSDIIWSPVLCLKVESRSVFRPAHLFGFWTVANMVWVHVWDSITHLFQIGFERLFLQIEIGVLIYISVKFHENLGWFAISKLLSNLYSQLANSVF